MRGTVAALVVAAAAATGVAGSVAAGPAPRPRQAVPAAANPSVADSCGTDVVLVLDASGSISSSGAVDDVRDAGDAFLTALADTGSTARVLQFASLSQELAPRAEVTGASLEADGLFRDALDAYYPQPERPSDVAIYSYYSGNPQSEASWRSANSNIQYTNWDQSLRQARADASELIVYVTDGDPTAYDFDAPGDPFDPGPPPDVGTNTNRGAADAVTLARAVDEANAAKAAGARVLAVGVGNALDNSASRARLVQIAGPQIVADDDFAGIDSINDVDVALVTEFDALAQFLRGVVSELCAPSLTVRKLAQSADDAHYRSTPGWDITVSPAVSSGSFAWILPDTDPAQAPTCDGVGDPGDGLARTCPTNDLGVASFQWEPDPTDAQSTARVEEVLQPGYIAGRPGPEPDWTCALRNTDGTERPVSGQLDAGLGFDLDVAPEQIVTCSIYNSFDYQPAIALSKVNAPTVVRADLPAGDREVTSTYVATNPGNTPLSGVALSDDLGERRCSPVEPGSGDTDDDGLLDPGEAWTFTCTTPAGGDPGTVDNTAEVVGTAPDGTQVDAQATDDVQIVRPAISLTKQVAGGGQGPASSIEVLAGTDVTYTFTATNTGTVPLADVALVDPNCDPGTIAPATVVALAPGASAALTCTKAGLTADVLNTATVTGTPQIAGYTGPNPPVAATASARVTVYTAGIVLTKAADHDLVFPGTAVTYTYGVRLAPGSVALLPRADAAGAPADRADWVHDDRCAPTTYQDGDGGEIGLLETGETWT